MWTCMCAKSLQWCPTLCDPIEYSPAGSSVHGILQARVLEWISMPSSRGSSQSRDQTCASWVSCIGSWLLHHQCHLGISMWMCMYDFKRNSYIIFQSDFTSIPKGNVDNSSCSILCHHLGFISCKILSHYSRCVVILNSRLFTFGDTVSLLLPVSSVQSLSHVWLFTTPSIAAHQASLSITNSLSSPKFMCIELWCHPANSSSVIPFSSCPQSLPASESFQMSQLFASGGQSIGVSASTWVLPVNAQEWSSLGWTGWISV